MKQLKAIAAMSINRVIGAGGKIPWHLPEDFKWFKQMTTGQVIVMGRKTFESIGKPLPNRETIVLSRSNFQYPGVRVIHDLKALIPTTDIPSPGLAATLSPPAATVREHGGSGGERDGVMGESGKYTQRKVFICGGAQIYTQALPLCLDLYLTQVKRHVEGDAFFPPFEERFELIEEISDYPEFKILHYRNKDR